MADKENLSANFALNVYSYLLLHSQNQRKLITETDSCYQDVNKSIRDFKESAKLKSIERKTLLTSAPEQVSNPDEIKTVTTQKEELAIVPNESTKKRETILAQSTASEDDHHQNINSKIPEKNVNFESKKLSVNCGESSKKRLSKSELKNGIEQRKSYQQELYPVKCKPALNPFTEILTSSDYLTIQDETAVRNFPKHLPLKISLFGPPFSFKSYIAKYIGEKYNLRVISIEETLNELIRLNQECAMTDPKAKCILDQIYEGIELTSEQKIYMVQQILLYSFESFESDEDYCLYMMNSKIEQEREQMVLYEKTRQEKKRRMSRFWKNQSNTREFVTQKAAFETIASAGFVLYDFPDNLDTALQLEYNLGGFTPEDKIQLSDTQLKNKLMMEVYPEVQHELINLVHDEGLKLGLNVDATNLFTPKKSAQSFFDIVLSIDCENEDSYSRAFENYHDESANIQVRLRDQRKSDIKNLNVDKLSLVIKPSENAFHLCEKLKFQSIEKNRIIDFYQRFRTFEGSQESILHVVSDADLTLAIDQINQIIDKTLARKTIYYNSLLTKYSEKKDRESSHLEKVSCLRSEFLHNSIVAKDTIASKIQTAIENLKASDVFISRNRTCDLMIQNWSSAILIYKCKITECLNEFSRQKAEIFTLNSSIFEKFVSILGQSDDRNHHLSSFVLDYNNFCLKFSDLTCIDEVKSEFHLRYFN